MPDPNFNGAPAIPAAVRSPELHAAIAEVARLRQANKAAHRDLEAARLELRLAEQADEAALADAIRHRTPEPAPSRPAAEERVVDAGRRARAGRQALEAAERDAVALLRQNRGKLSEARVPIAERAAAALATFEAALGDLISILEFEAWAAGRQSAGFADPRMGNRAAVEQALAALRQAVSLDPVVRGSLPRLVAAAKDSIVPVQTGWARDIAEENHAAREAERARRREFAALVRD